MGKGETLTRSTIKGAAHKFKTGHSQGKGQYRTPKEQYYRGFKCGVSGTDDML